MQGISHREYAVWQKWLEMQWNRPTRQDHLLMRIAQRIQELFKLTLAIATTVPKQRMQIPAVSLEDQDVQFEFKQTNTPTEDNAQKAEQTPEERQQWIEQQKSYWIAAMGPRLKVRTRARNNRA
jgi:hypothetical protein